MRARQLGVPVACAIVFLMPGSRRAGQCHDAPQQLWVGALWVVLTLVFESYSAGDRALMPRIFADYNPVRVCLMLLALACHLLRPDARRAPSPEEKNSMIIIRADGTAAASASKSTRRRRSPSMIATAPCAPAPATPSS